MPKPISTAPRLCLVHPDLFGRQGEVTWHQPTSPDDYASLRAAELQHFASVEILERLRGRDETGAWLEARTAMAGGRMSKLLRGHAHLTLRDLQAIEGVLGPVLVSLQFRRVPITDKRLRQAFAADTGWWGPQ